ncbi:MAG: S8 family serine peptidase [Chloroflexota bacterium]
MSKPLFQKFLLLCWIVMVATALISWQAKASSPQNRDCGDDCQTQTTLPVEGEGYDLRVPNAITLFAEPHEDLTSQISVTVQLTETEQTYTLSRITHVDLPPVPERYARADTQTATTLIGYQINVPNPNVSDEDVVLAVRNTLESQYEDVIECTGPMLVQASGHELIGSTGGTIIPISTSLITSIDTTWGLNAILHDENSHGIGTGINIAVFDGFHTMPAGLVNTAIDEYINLTTPLVAVVSPTLDVSLHGDIVASVIDDIAPNSKIQAYRVLNQNGHGTSIGQAEALSVAISQSITNSDPRYVINMSLEYTQLDECVQQAMDAMFDIAHVYNIPVVVASGNSGESTDAYPANYEPNLSVEASDIAKGLADYSNVSSDGIRAPGGDGSNIELRLPVLVEQLEEHHSVIGTSFAAPHATGVVANILSSDSFANATPDQLEVLLQLSMDDNCGVISLRYPDDPDYTCPQLSLSPQETNILVSDVHTITVQLHDVDKLYGAQFSVEFDPEVVEILDAQSFNPGVQIHPSDFLTEVTTIENVVNMSEGIIHYAVSLQGDNPGISGSGALAKIVVRGLVSDTTRISLKDAILVDRESNVLQHGIQPGHIIVFEHNTPGIVGNVILERRSSNIGAVVCVEDVSCMVTGEDGFYSFTDVPSTGNITIHHPSYLNTARSYTSDEGPNIVMPDVTLLGGDLNQDGVIDILDAVLMGLAWKSQNGDVNWNPTADIVDDGQVNIRDYVVVGVNLGQTAPGLWGTALARQQQKMRLLSARRVAQSDAETNTQLFITPNELQIDTIGQTIDVAVQIENVTELYGFSSELTFNPAVLQVMDINPIDAGVQIQVGEFLDAQQQVLVNRVDNETGRIELAVTQTYPAEAQQGSGVLARIQFESIGNGQSNIQFSNIQLVDGSAESLPTDTISLSGSDVQVGGYLMHLPFIAR